MISYDSYTYTPDQIQNIDDLNAVYVWAVQQRSKVDEHPAALPLIDDFERWYGSLEERVQSGALNPLGIGVHRIDQADVNEAKRKRAAILDALGEHIPDDYPVPHPVAPDKPPPEWTPLETAVWAVAGIAGGALLLKLLLD